MSFQTPALADPSPHSHQATSPSCASGSRRERVRLRDGHSARLTAVLSPAGCPKVPAALPARRFGSAAHRRAACHGDGTATRTMVSALGSAAEAAPRRGRALASLVFGSRAKGWEALPSGSVRGAAERSGWYSESVAGRLLKSPCFSPPRLLQSSAEERPGGPLVSKDSSRFGP